MSGGHALGVGCSVGREGLQPAQFLVQGIPQLFVAVPFGGGASQCFLGQARAFFGTEPFGALHVLSREFRRDRVTLFLQGGEPLGELGRVRRVHERLVRGALGIERGRVEGTFHGTLRGAGLELCGVQGPLLRFPLAHRAHEVLGAFEELGGRLETPDSPGQLLTRPVTPCHESLETRAGPRDVTVDPRPLLLEVLDLPPSSRDLGLAPAHPGQALLESGQFVLGVAAPGHGGVDVRVRTARERLGRAGLRPLPRCVGCIHGVLRGVPGGACAIECVVCDLVLGSGTGEVRVLRGSAHGARIPRLQPGGEGRGRTRVALRFERFHVLGSRPPCGFVLPVPARPFLFLRPGPCVLPTRGHGLPRGAGPFAHESLVLDLPQEFAMQFLAAGQGVPRGGEIPGEVRRPLLERRKGLAFARRLLLVPRERLLLGHGAPGGFARGHDCIAQSSGHLPGLVHGVHEARVRTQNVLSHAGQWRVPRDGGTQVGDGGVKGRDSPSGVTQFRERRLEPLCRLVLAQLPGGVLRLLRIRRKFIAAPREFAVPPDQRMQGLQSCVALLGLGVRRRRAVPCPAHRVHEGVAVVDQLTPPVRAPFIVGVRGHSVRGPLLRSGRRSIGRGSAVVGRTRVGFPTGGVRRGARGDVAGRPLIRWESQSGPERPGEVREDGVR